jgi:15,16-dihydrobiliverdin:ferredoxin oxidoreductase
MRRLFLLMVAIALLEKGAGFVGGARGAGQWALNVATAMPLSVTTPSVVGGRLGVETERLDKALPWGTSILEGRELLYMPMLEEQLRVMKEMGMEQVEVDDQFTFRKSEIKRKKARIGNMCFKSDIFRNVRMTYFDAGNNVQVYNSLWYPHYEYDLPLLGIDLISLGLNRVLTVVDFQPLHPTQEYSSKYIDQLASIRDQYPGLQGTLSGKIYDDTSFFSKQMLFGRYADESNVGSEVAPAFKEYLKAYTELAGVAEPNNDAAAMAAVKERQRTYDVYSAAKDPAVGLFDAYFGKEWSHNFVHKYLFTLCGEEEQAPKAHSFSISDTGSVSIGAGGTSSHS